MNLECCYETSCFQESRRTVHSRGFGTFLRLHLGRHLATRRPPLHCNYRENHSLATERSPAVLQGRGCGCWWHHTCNLLARKPENDTIHFRLHDAAVYWVMRPSSIRKVSARSVDHTIRTITALTSSSDLHNYGEGRYVSISRSKTECIRYSVYIHISLSCHVVLYSTK